MSQQQKQEQQITMSAADILLVTAIVPQQATQEQPILDQQSLTTLGTFNQMKNMFKTLM